MFWAKLFWLMCGHFVADYALQTDFIARGKNRHTAGAGMPWYYVMCAHAAIHGGFVGLLTGSTVLAVLETVLHFGIDVLKCEGYTDIHQDQGAHFACKVAWALC